LKAVPVQDEPEPRSPAVSDSAIRVDVGLLDKLMTLVGELVLARNQIMQFSTSQEDAAFLGTVQRLNLLTTELQANVMKTRMQPIGNIWNKFPRVVRDLAVACGKQVRIDLEGQETELDKTIIEAIRDPLTHMIRNAVDHGIEPPADRMAKGKPAEGRLSIRAFHEGGKVLIEIVDDGRGVDPRRVREKAIQAKLITPEQADRLGERELMNLIFLPGFSTADKVTHFSGRGVGMDVVRTNVERIGGTVEIDSRPGLGATVKMKIPLTLAIIPALTITDGAERYAIPQVSLLELVRLEGPQAHRSVEWIHGAAVHRLRGNLLPLVYLHRELHGGPARAENGVTNIVVLQADDRQFGLVVDAIHDTEEIVVKPLQKQIKGISAFSGATIMGDGKVALILDVLGLAQRAKVISGVRERSLGEKSSGATDTAGSRKTILLFATRDGGRMAIPLSLVARLEEFPRSTIERAGTRSLVQYRGEILPLIDLSRVLRQLSRSNGASNGRPRSSRRPDSVPAPSGDDTVSVVVYSDGGRIVGLVVGQILDIVEEALDSKCRAGRPGVLFTAVVQGRVTEFLDIEAIIRSADPNFFEQTEPVGAEA
jgi:two-component system, chemotaxis family, sensor kinase CheA